MERTDHWEALVLPIILEPEFSVQQLRMHKVMYGSLAAMDTMELAQIMVSPLNNIICNIKAT